MQSMMQECHSLIWLQKNVKNIKRACVAICQFPVCWNLCLCYWTGACLSGFWPYVHYWKRFVEHDWLESITQVLLSINYLILTDKLFSSLSIKLVVMVGSCIGGRGHDDVNIIHHDSFPFRWLSIELHNDKYKTESYSHLYFIQKTWIP